MTEYDLKKQTKKTVILLAGGKGSRMQNTHKGLLPFREKTMLHQIFHAVSMFDEIIIVANEPERYKEFGVQVISDIYMNKGPLGGIHAGLVAAKHEYSLVVACDMPFVSAQMGEKMYAYSGHADAYISHDGQRLHPLFGLYHKRSLPFITSCIESDKLKLKWFLDDIQTEYVDWSNEDYIRNPSRQLMNINTPEAYKMIQKIDQTPYVLCVVGASNSGKTTLVTHLIEALSQNGYKVGSIKHSHHIEMSGLKSKDNGKHFSAGANKTLLVGHTTVTTLERLSEEVQLESLIEKFTGYDILLVEGYKKSQYPKLEVVREAISQEPMCDVDTLEGIVTDMPLKEWPCLSFELNEQTSLIDWITYKIENKKF